VSNLKKVTKIYREALQSSQQRELRFYARIYGLPRDGSVANEEHLRADETMAKKMKESTKNNVWRKKTGDYVGVAEVTFPDGDACSRAVRLSKELRPKIQDRNVFVNWVRPEVSVAMDAPFKEAQKAVRNIWTGNDFKGNIKLNWRERALEGCGHTLCKQDEDDLTLRWMIPVEKCKNEATIRMAVQGA